jgi:hypothetical protein
MSEIPDSEPEISRLALLRQRICIGTWLVTLLLSLRGLFEFYGMKQKTDFEQIVIYVTEPFVQLFQFRFLQNLDIPAVTVFFTTVVVLVASYSLRLFLRYAEAQVSTRRYLARYYLVTAHKL